MSNITTETYAEKLYEELYDKHYREVGRLQMMLGI